MDVVSREDKDRSSVNLLKPLRRCSFEVSKWRQQYEYPRCSSGQCNRASGFQSDATACRARPEPCSANTEGYDERRLGHGGRALRTGSRPDHLLPGRAGPAARIHRFCSPAPVGAPAKRCQGYRVGPSGPQSVPGLRGEPRLGSYTWRGRRCLVATRPVCRDSQTAGMKSRGRQ